MNVVPSSYLALLSGVPLDNKKTPYTTVYHASQAAQFAEFSSFIKWSWTDFTYIRVSKGVVYVPKRADDIYGCSYMIFRNNGFGNKYFYAFITDVEYVNNETTAVSFQIDLLQTWIHDVNIKRSFVLRQHATSDNIGENTVPEPVECGEYIIQYRKEYFFDSFNIAIIWSKRADGRAPYRLVNGVATSLGISVLPATATDAEYQVVTSEIPDDAFYAIYQYPSSFGDASTTSPIIDQINFDYNLASVGGWTPRNNKLFTYPYTYLNVSNNSGGEAQYYFELFSDPNVQLFTRYGQILPTPIGALVPRNYRNISGANINEGVTLTEFPQPAFAGDAYKTFMLQNRNSVAVSQMTSAVSIVGDVLSRNMTGAAGDLMGVAGFEAKMADLKLRTPQTHGYLTGGGLNAALGRIGWTVDVCSIKYEFAKRIDDFFSMFGYAMNDTLQPNINGRPVWNYVQTKNCQIVGSAPPQAIAEIKSIFDGGVTFWKGVNNIGNYSLDNSIGGVVG